MRITYIFRHQSNERSIERVFEPIIQYMNDQGHLVKKDFAKSYKFWPFSLFYNMVRYAVYSYLKKDNIFHITGDVQYVSCFMNPSNTIMTIHDCISLHNENTPIWLKKLVYKLWYEIPLKRLKTITCISNATYQDIISFFPWAKDKLRIIPNPISPDFKPITKDFNKIQPRILHVGTRSNKNLERVIQALNGISCKLIIIGVLSEEQKCLLKKYKISYENRFHISDKEIITEYIRADIISFPSLFEGFGMPIIEGQTIGRPVLTSNREPMSFIAGQNAALVYPESVESIRNGFLKLINSKDYYDKVVENGLINAEKYNIKTIVSKYLEIYNSY